MEKEYSNGKLTIIWKPEVCIHAGNCVKLLPKVYNPKAVPWVKANNATSEQLISQIDQCPSGALSYQLKESGKK
ncbi:(4Fe-4S)-binding protein [Chryseobacterium ginsenosidimutans]|uniref:(4Fe-4S)-binding protein n=1 Tax=Chryseobacterium ginsenosidimutans TaxID=687846 RepID=UPI0031D2E2EA